MLLVFFNLFRFYVILPCLRDTVLYVRMTTSIFLNGASFELMCDMFPILRFFSFPSSIVTIVSVLCCNLDVVYVTIDVGSRFYIVNIGIRFFTSYFFVG